MTEGGSDDWGSGHAQQRDGQIAQRRHDLSPGAAADTAAIFIEGDVANPMDAILNRPVRAA